MTDAEFDTFVASANQELAQKQEALGTDFGIGSFKRFWWEQATQKLQFFDDADALKLEADVIYIGSYSEKSNSWKWAWSNSSLLPWIRKRSEKLRELEAVTGIDLFGQEKAFSIEDESMAWELAAMSVKHLGAMGCYRTPASRAEEATTFFAIASLWSV